MSESRRGNQIEAFAVIGTNGIMQRVFSFIGEAHQYVILHNSGTEEFTPFKVIRLAVPRTQGQATGRDRQKFEAGCRESARATCPTCASGDIPRPHSKLGGWFHIGPEGEDKQRIGCCAAAIYDLVPPVAQPVEEGKS